MTSCRWPSYCSIHCCCHDGKDVITLLKGFLEYTPEFAVSSHHYWHNTFQLASDSLKGSSLVMQHSVRQWAKWHCHMDHHRAQLPAKWHCHMDHHRAQLLTQHRCPDGNTFSVQTNVTFHRHQLVLLLTWLLRLKLFPLELSQARHMEHVLPTPVTYCINGTVCYDSLSIMTAAVCWMTW
jgi:hypothetical protein